MNYDYPKIKICGLRNLSEVICASDNGASWFGLIFVDNTPRSISIRRAERLISKTPKGIMPVAVTIDPSVKEIKKLTNIGIKTIQLHGSESIELCKTLKKNLGISIIKAINIRNLQDLVQAESYASNVDWLLFDYKDKLNLGGTGKSFDWKILSDKDLKYNWILSGGLDYTNIGKAVKITGAKALDISSGVEIKRGIKSIELIKEFCNSVKNLY